MNKKTIYTRHFQLYEQSVAAKTIIVLFPHPLAVENPAYVSHELHESKTQEKSAKKPTIIIYSASVTRA